MARLAGVSVTTVSHALSGRRAVAAGTRERVEQAVAQLGYRPNRAAHSLRTGVRRTISLIVPDIANPFFAELSRGVEDVAIARGFDVYLCNTDLRADREQLYLERALAVSVEGVILASTTTSAAARSLVLDLVRHRV
ncbi:MAG TPA: LacI family DNA-binding transcriptional regulator, partial [Acidimicrobiales bacterium]|nr:LacI family DNA-binding transcriptional regulator [Acidimicrobiales bacterium]